MLVLVSIVREIIRRGGVGSRVHPYRIYDNVRHVFNCQFAITRLPAEFRDSLLDIQESHRLRIPQYRRDETLGSSNRDAQIDIIAIDDRVAFDARVRRGYFLEREYGRTSKRGHEPELDVVLLRDIVLELGPHLYKARTCRSR